MTEQIITGYDGSATADEAVDWAADEAVRRGWPLTIVAAYDVPVMTDVTAGFPAADLLTAVRDSVKVGVDKVHERIRIANPGLDVSTRLVPGAPGMAILDGVTADDLVVVGASHRQGAAAFWLGSTTRHVLRHGTCPVIVVRAGAGGPPRRVVVGVDGSGTADDALRWAASEAGLHGIPLHVVHGWDYPYEVTTDDERLARDRYQQAATAVLDRARGIAREAHTDVTAALVEGGAVKALLDSVRPGDLAVLGSRGRGALVSGIFGSTVNSFLDQSPVSIAVVHPTGQS